MQPGFGGPGDSVAFLRNQVEQLWALVNSLRDGEGNPIAAGGGSGPGGAGPGGLQAHSHEGSSDGGPLEHVLFVEGSAPATPGAGFVYVYAKSDGKLYAKDSAGTEYDLTAAGGGGGGDVATDLIWDAAGDIARGTGSNTAARYALSVPAANVLNVLAVANGESTFTWKAILDGTNPAAIGTVAPGTSLIAAHRDHVHATGAGTPSTQAFGDAAATGSGPAAAMTDHKHAMPANPVTAHEGDTSSAHTAAGVDIVDSGALITATNVETALAELAALNRRYRTITYIIDNGGFTITTGIKGDLEIPFSGTIDRVTALSAESGSIVVDIWKDTYANYPPTDADSITASAPVTISAATKSQDSTLTGWGTTITAGETMRFNVDSCSGITRVTISLRVLVA